MPPPACPPCWEPVSNGESPCPGPSSRFPLFREITIVAMVTWLRPAFRRPSRPGARTGCPLLPCWGPAASAALATRDRAAQPTNPAAAGSRSAPRSAPRAAPPRCGRLGSHRAAARGWPGNKDAPAGRWPRCIGGGRAAGVEAWSHPISESWPHARRPCGAACPPDRPPRPAPYTDAVGERNCLSVVLIICHELLHSL